MTKVELVAEIVKSTKLSKAAVEAVLAALPKVTKRELAKKGNRFVLIPGLVRLMRATASARKARTMKLPSGETRRIGASPAHATVRAKVVPSLKALT